MQKNLSYQGFSCVPPVPPSHCEESASGGRRSNLAVRCEKNCEIASLRLAMTPKIIWGCPSARQSTLVTNGDILLPFGVFVKAMVHYVVANYGWRRWLVAEIHACHFGGTPCLALIAGPAGAYHVIPGMFASQAARDNVVYGEVSGLLAAILASVVISKKHLTPAQLPLYAGPFNQVNQSDH